MATSEWILSVRPCYHSNCVKWNEILQYRIPLAIQWTVLRSVCHEWDQMGSSFGELMGFISTHCLHGAYIKHWLVSCKTCQNNNSIMPNRLISSRHFTYSSPFIKANRTFSLLFCWTKVFVYNEFTSSKPYSNHTITCVNRREIHFIRMSSQCFITIHKSNNSAATKPHRIYLSVSMFAQSIFIMTAVDKGCSINTSVHYDMFQSYG